MLASHRGKNTEYYKALAARLRVCMFMSMDLSNCIRTTTGLTRDCAFTFGRQRWAGTARRLLKFLFPSALPWGAAGRLQCSAICGLEYARKLIQMQVLRALQARIHALASV